jgi:hypothetical protein
VLNRFKLIRVGTAALLIFAAGASCQTTEVLRPEAGASSPNPPNQGYDPAHLKDSPYNGNLPKPLYPSSERVQREFTVQYVYDYAYSAYTPIVSLPILARAQTKHETPEDALIALLSATRSGDYDGWLACWDETARNHFIAMAKEKKMDAAFWQKTWKQYFATVKDIVLVDRIETVGYVILDARTSGSPPFPTALKHVNSQWLATDDLSSDQMMMNFRPGLAGIVQHISPQPMSTLTEGYTQEAEAQQEFLHSHTALNNVKRVGK